MYLLDTNVVSEYRKIKNGKGDRNVTVWARRVPTGTLFLSCITILELEYGVLRLERQDAAQGSVLREWLDHSVLPAFRNQTLPIDSAIGKRCAALHIPIRRPDRDALIAATALVHRMTVVTRNVADFKSMGVPIINPWEP